ncbi:MAG: pyridoxal phosphate-dependent aminotransferase [Nitrospiraceae bacterium]|nr:pyridoxal phosphate-dependent aminotransferase [Nitrospiraceae bacterium]
MTITASPMTTIARHTVNDVLGTLPRSGIRRLTDQVMGSRDMDDAIQLGFGQPQEATDDLIRKAIIKATDERTLGYTENAGMRVLRDAIATKLAVRNHIETDVESIFVTPGATYGVAVTIGCLINPGDEVLVPDPGYPNFAAAVHHYGGVVKFYQLRQDTGFVPDLNELAALISPATKALIINSPGNPTGAVIDAGMMEQLVRLTRERGLWLVSDEVYETYVYGCRHVSPLSLSGSDHVVGLYSFSKSYNITGLRVGYVVTPHPAVRRALLNAQELYISCAPSISQYAALQALADGGAYPEAMRAAYQQKRDLVMNMLGPYAGRRPEGAFYLLVDIGFTGLHSDEFADRLLRDTHVVVAPGATFGPSSDQYIRIAFTPQVEKLRAGLTRLKQFLSQWPIADEKDHQ